MASVKVTDFIRSSANYVRQSVAWANANKDPYLTKAEARALPKDLRANYETHRVLGNGNSRVGADKFVEKYSSYVKMHATFADKNHDGYLTREEAKSLPRDLQDNFRNYDRLVVNR